MIEHLKVALKASAQSDESQYFEFRVLEVESNTHIQFAWRISALSDCGLWWLVVCPKVCVPKVFATNELLSSGE